MSSLSTLPKGDSAWLLRKAIERIIQQVSVLETNIGVSTSGNSANTEVIFNDAGVLRGDAGLLFNKTTDTLTAGSATITGALTANGGIAMANATSLTFGGELTLSSNSASGLFIRGRATGGITFQESTGANPLLNMSNAGIFTFSDGAGGTRMTLNSTGLGIGVAPVADCKLTVRGGSFFDRGATSGASQLLLSLAASSGANYGQISNTGTRWALGFGVSLTTVGTEALIWDSSGNVGIGVTPVYKLDTYTKLQGAVGEKRFANRTSNKILVKRYFGILADTALFSIECGTAGTAAMAAFEINVFATGQKSGSSSDRQFYGKWYVTRNLAGTFTITSAFSSGSSGAFTVTASGTSLNVNGIFSVISDGSACVEITGYIGGRDTVDETNLTVTMP